MVTPKSPFLVQQGFISPKACEQIVYDLDFFDPRLDKEGKPMKGVRQHEANQNIIFDRFKDYIPNIEKHYNVVRRGTTEMDFEFYAQGVVSQPLCESCNYLRQKWVKTHDRDFTHLLFLSDYHENPNFDNEFEVYGGKLEFPQHAFGFLPQRGTLITYPSGPHFINAIAPILVGDLLLVKWHLATQDSYLYDPKQFPGDYRTWFPPELT